jgi:hypothetical protein
MFDQLFFRSDALTPQLRCPNRRLFVRPLHQHRPQIGVSFFTDMHLRLALSHLVNAGIGQLILRWQMTLVVG